MSEADLFERHRHLVLLHLVSHLVRHTHQRLHHIKMSTIWPQMRQTGRLNGHGEKEKHGEGEMRPQEERDGDTEGW